MKKTILKHALAALTGVALMAGGASAAIMTNNLSSNDSRYIEFDFGQAGTSSNLSFYSGGANAATNQIYDNEFGWNVFLEYTIGATHTGSWLSDTSFWTAVDAALLPSTAQSFVSTVDPSITVEVIANLATASNVITFDYNVLSGTNNMQDVTLFAYLDPDLDGDSDDDNASAVPYFLNQTMLLTTGNTSPVTSLGLVNGGVTGGATFKAWEMDDFPALLAKINGIDTNDLSNLISGSNPFDVTAALQYDLGDIAANGRAGAAVELIVNPVPEPGTMLLLGFGVIGLVGTIRRRRSNILD